MYRKPAPPIEDIRCPHCQEKHLSPFCEGVARYKPRDPLDLVIVEEKPLQELLEDLSEAISDCLFLEL